MPHQMKNNNNQKKRVCRKDISPLTRVNLSESGTESQKSEPKKYLKFLDPPQNVFRHNRHILWIQSRSWIVNLNEAKNFPKTTFVKTLGSLCRTRRLLER